MKYLIAAVAALAVMGGSAAMAQPFSAYNAPNYSDYNARPYNPQPYSYTNVYSGAGHQMQGRYGQGGYGYAAPWGGQAYSRAPSYNAGPAYGERHVRRDVYRDRDRQGARRGHGGW